MDISIEMIAHIECGFTEKFGIPRQSGIVGTEARIVFEKKYASEDAVRGLENYSHIWLLWHFSKSESTGFHATVRPPRLGGNTRMGVFATRSPFRPNPIGLSSVKLIRIEHDPSLGPVLVVSGADLADGTPIFDIKPYLAYTDSHPDAACGFSDAVRDVSLAVVFPEELRKGVPAKTVSEIIAILAEDPRPSYQDDPEREYGFYYGEYEIKFKVSEKTACVTACNNKQAVVK